MTVQADHCRQLWLTFDPCELVVVLRAASPNLAPNCIHLSRRDDHSSCTKFLRFAEIVRCVRALQYCRNAAASASFHNTREYGQICYFLRPKISVAQSLERMYLDFSARYIHFTYQFGSLKSQRRLTVI